MAHILSSFRSGSNVARKSRAASRSRKTHPQAVCGIDIELRQQVDKLLCLVAIGLRRQGPFGHLELALAPCLQRSQFAKPAPDLGGCVGIGLLARRQAHVAASARRLVVGQPTPRERAMMALATSSVSMPGP
jgi:hypothetical protein